MSDEKAEWWKKGFGLDLESVVEKLQNVYPETPPSYPETPRDYPTPPPDYPTPPRAYPTPPPDYPTPPNYPTPPRGYPTPPRGYPTPPRGYPTPPRGYPTPPPSYPETPPDYPTPPPNRPTPPRGYPTPPPGYPETPPGYPETPPSYPGKPPGYGHCTGSVGYGGKNKKADVEAVQAALNERANAGLDVDGRCGPKTIKAIKAFQETLGGFKPDGLVEPGKRTARALAGEPYVVPAPPKPEPRPERPKPEPRPERPKPEPRPERPKLPTDPTPPKPPPAPSLKERAFAILQEIIRIARDIVAKLKHLIGLFASVAADVCRSQIVLFGIAATALISSYLSLVAAAAAEGLVVLALPATIALAGAFVRTIASLAAVIVTANNVRDCLKDEVLSAKQAGDQEKVARLEKVIADLNNTVSGLENDARRIKALFAQLEALAR